MEKDIREEMLKGGAPLLIDFYAPWCVPCQMQARVIDEIAKEYGSRLRILKINVDEQPEYADMFSVSSIPTVVIMKDGRVTNSTVGYHEKAYLIRVIERQ